MRNFKPSAEGYRETTQTSRHFLFEISEEPDTCALVASIRPKLSATPVRCPEFPLSIACINCLGVFGTL